MGIGDRITEVRKRNGLSQAELAKRSGISQAGISYIEKGLRSPSSDTLELLASALGCSVSYLMGETNDPKAISQSYAMAASLDASADVQRSPASDDDLKFALFGGAQDITPEMFEEVRSFARFVLEREKNKQK